MNKWKPNQLQKHQYIQLITEMEELESTHAGLSFHSNYSTAYVSTSDGTIRVSNHAKHAGHRSYYSADYDQDIQVRGKKQLLSKVKELLGVS